jgi:hypothetical protein
VQLPRGTLRPQLFYHCSALQQSDGFGYSELKPWGSLDGGQIARDRRYELAKETAGKTCGRTVAVILDYQDTYGTYRIGRCSGRPRSHLLVRSNDGLGCPSLLPPAPPARVSGGVQLSEPVSEVKRLDESRKHWHQYCYNSRLSTKNCGYTSTADAFRRGKVFLRQALSPVSPSNWPGLGSTEVYQHTPGRRTATVCK